MTTWTALCDFDGTISLEDVTDSLLVRFARPGWDALEFAWREGRIGSRECLAGQVALLDCSRGELDEHLAAMEIDPDFPAFVEALRVNGIPLQVVSDGLDYAIAALLARHGLQRLPVTANRLVQAGPRAWRLEFPHALADCRSASGNCKCAQAARAAALPAGRVLLIGDGASDFCVADRAHLIFARRRLLEYCSDKGLAHLPAANFRQALDLLPGLLENASIAESRAG
ncbi:MAG: phosphatase [Betaproteobacteria bacterium]|nr:phosphatase [Betaproteobacteria bacterium]